MGVMAFGLRKDFKLRQLVNRKVSTPEQLVRLVEKVFRWGLFLNVKDAESLLKDWAP